LYCILSLRVQETEDDEQTISLCILACKPLTCKLDVQTLRFLNIFLLVAGYSWQACWLFECLWQLLFLLQLPVGMVACLVCLLGALASMLYALSRLYA